MIGNFKSFGIIACAAFALSACVAIEPQQTSLAINSPFENFELAGAEVAYAELPLAGPMPEARPDIVFLASSENTSPLTIGVSAQPSELQAMLPPDGLKSNLPAEISNPAEPVIATSSERNCLMRTMYFESNRSSPEGLLAVGTVVMHRLEHGTWGKSVCSVVQARNQFAPGLMTRNMQGDLSDLAILAEQILAGKRHPKLAKNVMYFHVAGMKFPYKNMRYVHAAGGNTFYYKAQRTRRT